MPPISEERKKAISKGIEDAGLSSDYFETFTKIAEGIELDNDATYASIIEVAKTIKVLKDTFKEDYPAVRHKLVPIFRQLEADNDRRKGKTESNNLPFRLYTTGPIPFNTAAKQEMKQGMNQGKKREEKQEK